MLLISGPTNAVSQNASYNACDSLAPFIHPLRLLNSDDGIKDIAPFLKNKEIIGMGEAAHGAHEFFDIKCRLFKYIVEHEDYRFFVIEATLGNTYALNRYLIYDEGDALKALYHLDNYYWFCDELLQLVNWMHNYNKGKKLDEKLRFYGFDINSLDGPAYAIAAYFKRVDPSLYLKYTDLKGLLMSSGKSNLEEINDLHRQMADNKDKYLSSSDTWEYDFIMQSFNNLDQCKDVNKFSEEARDMLLVDNVRWIYEHVSHHFFIWAHNYHIAKAKVEDSETMGSLLHKALPNAYFTIGFDFNSGAVWAKKGASIPSVILHGNKNVKNEVGPAKDGSLTALLSSCNPSPVFLLDVAGASLHSSYCRQFLNQYADINEAGAWCSARHPFCAYDIGHSYDLLLHLDKVTPSHHFILHPDYEPMLNR